MAHRRRVPWIILAALSGAAAGCTNEAPVQPVPDEQPQREEPVNAPSDRPQNDGLQHGGS